MQRSRLEQTRVRRQLLAVLVMGVWVSRCDWLAQACTNDFHFHLSLRPNLKSPERYELEMEQLSGAPMWVRLEGPGMDASAFELSPAEGEELQRRLEVAGTWELPDGDSGEPELCVYYTECEIERGDQHHFSQWRGLPPQQGRVAQLFLESSHFVDWTGRALRWCAANKS